MGPQGRIGLGGAVSLPGSGAPRVESSEEKIMEFFWSKSRWLLPVTIAMGTVMIGMCLSDARDVITTGQLFGHPAMAESGHMPSASQTESASRQPAPSSSPASASASASASSAEPPVASATESSSATATEAAQEKPGTASSEAAPMPSGEPPADEESSPAEMDILKQLSARRQALDHRAQDIDKREALLKIYEQRIEQKTRELTALRQQIQTLLGQANETQAAQLDNLVKIYETMKPEDAAKIFDTLDMQILLGVIQRMKPKSTAPIMAKMSAERAKEVTVSLLKQDKLPQVK